MGIILSFHDIKTKLNLPSFMEIIFWHHGEFELSEITEYSEGENHPCKNGSKWVNMKVNP